VYVERLTTLVSAALATALVVADLAAFADSKTWRSLVVEPMRHCPL
jgi:hypothetical protein